MTYKFTIKGRLAGLNDLIYGYWTTVHALKREATELVAWSAKAAKIPRIKGKCRLTVQCYEKNRRRDIDNAVSGATKCILDGLQACGILKNDTANCVIPIMPPPMYDKENPRIEVTIECLNQKDISRK